MEIDIHTINFMRLFGFGFKFKFILFSKVSSFKVLGLWIFVFAIWFFCLTFDLKELGIRVSCINILDFSTYNAHF
jgi:hypothetical protein